MSQSVCTITPNPALDLGGTVDDLKPNEKSYVSDPTRWPGGNSINVARVLTRLKVPVVATGFLGGSIGQEIKDLLAQEKVKHRFVEIAGHTRINITISNNSNHKQTRLSFPGPTIQRNEKNELFRSLKSRSNMSLMVIGGSLPKGFTEMDITHLLKIARSKDIRAVVDCPGKILKKIISQRPFLIKPNLVEFQDLIGHRVTSLRSVLEQARKLLDLVPIICVSSVEGGTLMVSKERSYFGRIPPVKIRSTVGAGDSMVASIVAQLHQNNNDLGDLLRWGLAASAATLSVPGTALGQAEQIESLYQKTKVDLVTAAGHSFAFPKF